MFDNSSVAAAIKHWTVFKLYKGDDLALDLNISGEIVRIYGELTTKN